METARSGPFVFRLGLYADPDLSPANLGEAFDYYSAIPGWGWRAIVYRARGEWQGGAGSFGAARGDIEYAPADPEGELESYFPCGRVVALKEGGFALEGGVCLPPQESLALGDEFSLWARLREGEGNYGVELRCQLRENESWDALEPVVLGCEAGPPPLRQQRQWSPADEATHRAAPPVYPEPERPGLPSELSPEAVRALDLAREEAMYLRLEEIGSDQILLGVLCEGSGQAARALAQVGVEPRAARAAEEFLSSAAPSHHVSNPAFSRVARKALQLASDEARRLGESKVDTLHLLLGLLRQKGRAVEVLDWLGVPLPKIRHLLTRPGDIYV